MSIAEQLDSIMGLSAGATKREMFRTGLTMAKVTNIKDEQKLNRVKCLPIGGDTQEETDWCYVMTPMGGNSCGTFFFPQVNDLVVLAYLDGDPHRPMVLGGFWNTDVMPPRTIQEGKAEEYVVRTPKGIEILLQDTENKQKVSLTMPSGSILVLDDEESRVTVRDKEGNNALIMDLKGGELTLKAKTKISIEAGDTKIQLGSDGNITQKGSATVSIEGTDIQAKASSKLSMQGSSAEVKGSADLNLESSGSTVLKGSLVKIN